LAKEGKEHFISILLALHTAAMQHMGKIKNPLTGNIQKNLQAAKETIDTLEAIRVRCEGNLDTEEDKFINNLLTELRLNFVQEKEEEEKTEEKVDKPEKEIKEEEPKKESEVKGEKKEEKKNKKRNSKKDNG